MKKISCDICKKEVGVSVETRNYGVTLIPITTSNYPAGAFYNQKESFVDVCTDCSNAIAESINKTVDQLKKDK